MNDTLTERDSGGEPCFSPPNNDLDCRQLIDGLTALVGAYSVPGLDIRATLERSRKDVAALAEANKQVLHGVHIAMAGEGELLSRTFEQTMQVIRNLSTSESLMDLKERQVSLLVDVLEAALAAMQEVAGSIAAANREAFDTLQSRLSEKVSDIQNALDAASHPTEEERG